MKKLTTLFLAILITFLFVACGETNVDSQFDQQETSRPQSVTTAPGQEYDEDDPMSVLEKITNDFVDVTSNLTLKLEETFTDVGTTYEDYQKNKGLVDEWVTFVLSESDNLFARTKENSIVYFKLIAIDENHKYSEFCDDALDEYYDVVYDNAMDEYYDALYDDAMDTLYDEYYNGIIDDAFDDVKYEEWVDASEESYKQWYDVSSVIYQKWLDESSYIYGLWYAMNSAFCWDKNFDVDVIVAEYEKGEAEKDVEEVEEESKVYVDFEESTQSESTNNSTEDIRPDFKEAMDAYEAFYDEYCEFMKQYKENLYDFSLLAKYTEMMKKTVEINESFEEWDEEEMNNAELKYYLEVNNRVMQKLIDVAG